MQKEEFPALECPSCDRGTKPRSVNNDGSVTYTCEAKNHLATHGHPMTWRIAEDGSFLERTPSGRYE